MHIYIYTHVIIKRIYIRNETTDLLIMIFNSIRTETIQIKIHYIYIYTQIYVYIYK